MPRITNEEVVKAICAAPIDANDAAITGDWISMKNASHCTITVLTGAGWGSAAALTLTQATAVAGTGTKALAFSWMWTNDGATGASTLTKTAVTSNTFNVDTAGAIYIIEIDADTLDVDGDFDVLGLSLADPGAAGLVSIEYELSGTRYMNAPNALVD